MAARGWKHFGPEHTGTVVYGKAGGALVYCTINTRKGRTLVTATASERRDDPAVAEVRVVP
jgi:hypothetical protein